MAIGKDIKDLYDLLVKQELTDKSFDEFKSAVENEQYRDKVYEVLVDRNLYEGEKAEFDDNYFFEYTPAATQKKKTFPMVLLQRTIRIPCPILEI